jgi:regulatory protein PHO2
VSVPGPQFVATHHFLTIRRLPLSLIARDERLATHQLHVSTSQPTVDFPSCLKQVSNEDSEFPGAESPMSSQSESVTKSPDAQLESASNSALSPSMEAETTTSSPDANHRRISTSSSSRSVVGEREKRKRSRVTPDQLVHLERFFSMDRSPTAARRREISELLGMQERQTQIWFQNR